MPLNEVGTAMAGKNDGQDLALSHALLRKFIGYLALALPFLLPVITQVSGSSIPDSISEYYYSPGRDWLVGSLCAIAVFLLAYRGYGGGGISNWRSNDRWLAVLMGFCALLVALVPAGNKCGLPGDNTTSLMALLQVFLGDWAKSLHFIGAGGLMACMAAMCIGYFTKYAPSGDSMRTRFETNAHVDTEKRNRNWIYLICGVIIIAATLTAGASLLQGPGCGTRVLYWSETVAVTAFAIAWLVKGEVLSDVGLQKQREPK
jgi:hypothetical protein